MTIEGRQTTDLRCTTVPCGRSRGQVLGWVVIVQDVTDIKASTRLKEKGLDMVSHELRSPLASLRVMAQVLNGVAGELTDSDRERVAVTIERETDRLSRLVADLLDISQLERPDYAVHLVAVSVSDVVERVYDLYAPQAEAQGKTLFQELPDNFPAALGDLDRLVQILTNLVDNAIKYTPPEGKITLGGQATEDAVQVWVQDTGPGISPEMATVVFEKFAQAGQAPGGTTGQRGVGLGLYLARTLALRQGGDLTLTSRVGEGSTFTLTLPRADACPPTGGARRLSSFAR
jgi:signal transduction histidine kinase